MPQLVDDNIFCDENSDPENGELNRTLHRNSCVNVDFLKRETTENLNCTEVEVSLKTMNLCITIAICKKRLNLQIT